jgi:hypothetical protein
MVKFLKEKKVVIILNGRYAGKKAVIIDTFEKFVIVLSFVDVVWAFMICLDSSLLLLVLFCSRV